jgi:hypothetical protein
MDTKAAIAVLSGKRKRAVESGEENKELGGTLQKM